MVKKLFSIASVVAVTLAMASCSSEVEEPITETKGNTESVTLTISMPEEIQTRATNSDVVISSGACINTLHFAMYLVDTKTVIYTSEKTSDVHYSGLKADYDSESKTFSIKLPYVPKSQAFDMIFWACHEEEGYKPYKFDYEDQSVTIDYKGIKNNEETRDAFFTSEKGVVLSKSNGKVITLRRPFAQLNIGLKSDDVNINGNVDKDLDYVGTAVTVKNVYSKLNLFTGVASEADGASGLVDVTFEATDKIDSENNPWPLTDDSGYEWVSMNYILTGSRLLEEETDNVNKAKQENMDIEFTSYCISKTNESWSRTYKISAVPFQRNYRTFILGELSTVFSLKILIAPDFYNQSVENLDPKEYH